MIVGTVTLPSGTQIDPQRPLEKQIDIHDIAEQLAQMPAYCGTLTLEISIGQSALISAGIYERIASNPDIRIVQYLLLRDAWQYVFRNIRVPLVQTLERGCIDQLRDMQDRLQTKIFAKFDVPPHLSQEQSRELHLAADAQHVFNLVRFGKWPRETLPRTNGPALECLDQLDLFDQPIQVLDAPLVTEKYLDYFSHAAHIRLQAIKQPISSAANDMDLDPNYLFSRN